MPGNLTLETLREAFAAGEIDTVIVADRHAGPADGQALPRRPFPRMAAGKETHCCNYLLATDMEMYTVPGYAASSWEKGYGDYVMKPDLSTLRRVPWLEERRWCCATCSTTTPTRRCRIRRAPSSSARSRGRKMGFSADDGDRARILRLREQLRGAAR
jgi:glutamine synthetase